MLLPITYGTTITGGDFVVDIDIADNAQVQGGDFNVNLADGIFFNDLSIPISITTPPIIIPSSGGGGGIVSTPIPFNFTKKNEENTSYIHINQRTNNIIRFTVSINQSQLNDNLTLFYSINYGNYQMRKMGYNNKGSFTTELVFNTENLENLKRYDVVYKIKPNDILTYYVEGRRIDKFIRSPDYDNDIYIWKEIKPTILFNNLTKDMIIYLLFIPIIILLFLFINYKKRQEK